MRISWEIPCAGFFLAAFVGLVGSPSASAAPPWAPWKGAATAPAGYEEVYGTTAGGKVYVMGGLKAQRPQGLVLEYDPSTDKWETKKKMPVPFHHVGVASLGGKLYLMGGFVHPGKGRWAWTPVANAWEYTPATDSWRKLAPLPSPRGGMSCAALNGKVHCVGGARLPAWSKESGLFPGLEIEELTEHLAYDPATDKWSAKAPMSTPRNHFALEAVGGKLYAIGGRVGHAFVSGWSQPIAAVEEYDPAIDGWRPRNPMPTPRSSIASAVVGGKIHVMGGEEYRGTFIGVHRTHEVYDPGKNLWTVSAPLRTPRHGFVAAAVGNRLFAISGANVAGGGGPHINLKTNEVMTVK